MIALDRGKYRAGYVTGQILGDLEDLKVKIAYAVELINRGETHVPNLSLLANSIDTRVAALREIKDAIAVLECQDAEGK